MSPPSPSSKRCKFWLPKKKRFCSSAPLSNSSKFCGNHSESSSSQWIQCPIDPSHRVLVENLEGHKKRCPLLKHEKSLEIQPFYQKGINTGFDLDELEQHHHQHNGFELPLDSVGVENAIISSEKKRKAVFSMTPRKISLLLDKIRSIHESICGDIHDSYKIPPACDIWINRQVDRKIPFQEKHVQQQASILGNLEEFEVINNTLSECDRQPSSNNDSNVLEAVVEFGAGRGYLTQVLADCYGFNKVLLVERKSYKLKADRSLRQKEGLILERLRIDIEDLNLNAVESLQGIPYLAIGKHLCGPATDMTLRCCLVEQRNHSSIEQCHAGSDLRGLAIATCCHHLCQWKHYINKSYLTNMGISKEEFHAMTWFTSWAVDADHSSALSDAADAVNLTPDVLPIVREKKDVGEEEEEVEATIKELKAVQRATIGFMCKDIIDMGRLMWLKQHRQGLLEARLVKYVPSNISPENHLLIAKLSSKTHATAV